MFIFFLKIAILGAVVELTTEAWLVFHNICICFMYLNRFYHHFSIHSTFLFPPPSLGHQDMVLGLWQIKLGCGGHGSLPSKKKKESKEPSLRPPNSRLVMPETLLHTVWAEITSALIPLKLLRSILPTFNQSMHWVLITGSGLWASGLGKFSQWAILTFSLTKLLSDQKAVKQH